MPEVSAFYDGRSDKDFERDQERFRRQLRRDTLRTFGVKPWQAGLVPVPRRVRAWHKLTFARRRALRRLKDDR